MVSLFVLCFWMVVVAYVDLGCVGVLWFSGGMIVYLDCVFD